MADDMSVDTPGPASASRTQQAQEQQASANAGADAARKAQPNASAALPASDVQATAAVQADRGERARDVTGATSAGATAPRANASAEPPPPTAPTPASPAPASALTPEHQKQSDDIKARFKAADATHAGGNPTKANDDRQRTVRDATTAASKITDPVQRDAFVKSFANEAGAAVGQAILKSGGAVSSLQALGEQGSKETAQQLTKAATDVAGLDKIVPLSSASSNVGAAARTELAARQQKYADFAKGFKDGAKDTITGLAHTGAGAYKYATDAKFRDHVNKAASALQQAIKTPEGQEQIGKALGAAGDKLVEAMKNNPAYAAGYVAGSLAAGGAVAKGLSALGKAATALKPVADAANRAKAIAADPKTKMAALGAGALALDQRGVQKTIDDALKTAGHAPGHTLAGIAAMATGQGRRLLKAAMQHVRDAVDRVRNRPPINAPVSQ